MVYRIVPAVSLDFNVDVIKAKERSSNKMKIVWSATTRKKCFVNVKSKQTSTSIHITLPSNADSQAFSLLDIKHAAEFCTLKLDFRKQNRPAMAADKLDMMLQSLAMLYHPNFMKNVPRGKEDYQDNDDTTQKLAQAMTAFQRLKTMEIWMLQLTLKMTKQLPVHCELASLKIVDARIESDAFTAFSECFPALEYLTLSSCVFANGNDDTNDNNSIWINLQQKSLTTLILIDDRNRKKREEPNHQGKLYTPALFHLESTFQETHLYLMLMPLHTMPLKIYKKQFEICSKEPYTIIDISCGSVDTIIIRLGHISHALDVSKYL